MNDGYGNIDDELYGTEYTMANGVEDQAGEEPPYGRQRHGLEHVPDTAGTWP